MRDKEAILQLIKKAILFYILAHTQTLKEEVGNCKQNLDSYINKQKKHF